MRKIYLTCGVPGSGKTTWCTQKVMNEGWVHNSRDAVRFMKILDYEDYFAHEDDVFSTFVNNIQNDIDNGVENIIADATHLNSASRNKLLSKLSLKDYEVWYVVFLVDLDTALERNQQRTGRARVPDTVIRNMYNNFQMPEGNIIIINEKGEEVI